jgi:hypothetical protein
MNGMNLGTTDARTTTLRPPAGSRWTTERDIVRDLCVERSRAGFLAARLLKFGDGADAPADLAPLSRDIEQTRAELGAVVRSYARLLLRMGESRNAVLVLVNELASQANGGRSGTNTQAVEELQEDLLEWALQAVG